MIAIQFKRNAIHLSNLLEKEKAVVEDAQLKLEMNHDMMQITRLYVQEPLDDVFYAGHCFGGFIGLYVDGFGHQIFVMYLYFILIYLCLRRLFFYINPSWL